MEQFKIGPLNCTKILQLTCSVLLYSPLPHWSIHAISSESTIKLLAFLAIGIELFNMRKEGYIIGPEWNGLRMDSLIAHKYYNIYAVCSSLNLFHTGLFMQSHQQLL
jgi:hypothetical protein